MITKITFQMSEDDICCVEPHGDNNEGDHGGDDAGQGDGRDGDGVPELVLGPGNHIDLVIV